MLNENLTFLVSVNPMWCELGFQELQYEGKVFTKKEELHLTVIGFKTAKIIREKAKVDPSIVQRIDQLASEFDWNPGLDLRESYIISRGEESSIISLATCCHQNLENLYEELNEILETSIPTPFPHVTIMLSNSKMGIGINSEEEFRSFNPIPVGGLLL